jgi:hypothetical protein
VEKDGLFFFSGGQMKKFDLRAFDRRFAAYYA